LNGVVSVGWSKLEAERRMKGPLTVEEERRTVLRFARRNKRNERESKSSSHKAEGDPRMKMDGIWICLLTRLGSRPKSKELFPPLNAMSPNTF